MTAVNLESYALALEPVPDAALEQAMVTLMRTEGAFIPDAGTMFGAALDLLDPEPGAAEAWVAVEKHARGKNVNLSNRMLAALDAMGGNPGDWQEDELPFRRREFMTEFEKQRARWRSAAQAGRLALPKGKVQNSELLMGGNG